MAVLTIQEGTAAAGLNPTLAASDAAGDSFVNDGNTVFVVENSNAATRTLTVTAQVTTTDKAGFGRTLTVPNQVATIAATTGRTILGPFPKAYEDANGRVTVTYSAVTNVTVAAVRIRPAV